MFLQHLNERQAAAFLYIAECVAAADGKIKYPEITKISSFFKQLNPHITPEECSVDTAGTIFDTSKARVAALLELLVLAHTDHDYHASEQDLIRSVSDAFGFSRETLDQMTVWAARHAQLIRDARTFFED